MRPVLHVGVLDIHVRHYSASRVHRSGFGCLEMQLKSKLSFPITGFFSLFQLWTRDHLTFSCFKTLTTLRPIAVNASRKFCILENHYQILMFFYLSKQIFSDLPQFKVNIVPGQNDSKKQVTDTQFRSAGIFLNLREFRQSVKKSTFLRLRVIKNVKIIRNRLKAAAHKPIFCRPTKNLYLSASVWGIQTSLRQDRGWSGDIWQC